MKFRKSVSVLVAGMLVGSMLVACSNKEADTEQEDVVTQQEETVEEYNTSSDDEYEADTDESSAADTTDYVPTVEEVDEFLKTGKWPSSADTAVKMSIFKSICEDVKQDILDDLEDEYVYRCETEGTVTVEDFLIEKGYVDGYIH